MRAAGVQWAEGEPATTVAGAFAGKTFVLTGTLPTLSREDKQKAIRLLDERGAFILRRPPVAGALGGLAPGGFAVAGAPAAACAQSANAPAHSHPARPGERALATVRDDDIFASSGLGPQTSDRLNAAPAWKIHAKINVRPAPQPGARCGTEPETPGLATRFP